MGEGRNLHSSSPVKKTKAQTLLSLHTFYFTTIQFILLYGMIKLQSLQHSLVLNILVHDTVFMHSNAC